MLAPRGLIATLVLVAVTTAGCGSTVQMSGRAVEGGEGLGAPGGPVDQPLDTDAEPAGVQPGAGDPPTGGMPASTGNVDGGPGTARQPSTSTTVKRGAGTVLVGFQYLDESGGNGIPGTTNQSSGDSRAQAKAVVDWINAHGGAGGRAVKLAPHAVDLAALNNGESASEIEKNCTAWTQDTHPVIATLRFNHPDLIRCLGTKGVPTIGGAAVAPESSYRNFPYFHAAQASYDHGAVTAVRAFSSTRFLTRDSKVGVVVQKDNIVNGTRDALLAALKAHGIPFEVFEASASNIAEGAQGVAAAVLKFRTDDVTHVMFVSYGGGAGYLFMNAAESQQYRPNYALTTADSPALLAANSPPAQLANAKMLGWLPGEANSEQARVLSGWNDTGRLCVSILRKAGVAFTTPTVGLNALSVCDQLLTVRAILNRTDDISVAGVRSGVARLGSSYQSPRAFRTVLGPRRSAGAAHSRYLSFDASCRCWTAGARGPDL